VRNFQRKAVDKIIQVESVERNWRSRRTYTLKKEGS
jgi:hypothetical protein